MCKVAQLARLGGLEMDAVLCSSVNEKGREV